MLTRISGSWLSTRTRSRSAVTTKDGTLVEHLPSRALKQVSVTWAREPGHSDSQDRDCSPHDSLHDLYRSIILAHGERVKWPPKWCLTREYSRTFALLIMDCF